MLKGTVYIQIFSEQNVFPNPQFTKQLPKDKRPRTIDSFTIVRNYLFIQNYTLLQRETFLTKLYTINSSPLPVTK